jgi:hypothetical protein
VACADEAVEVVPKEKTKVDAMKLFDDEMKK